MKRTLVAFLVSISLIVALFPIRCSAVVKGLDIHAREAVLMEVSTDKVLFEQNANAPIEPASFTKILTLYLVFEALEAGQIHLQDPVWISKRAWKTGGSKMFIEVGKKVPLETLIKGIAVVSGNDACVAVAEHLYGTVEAFVDAMNRKAKELGMRHSHFVNPNGLPAKGQLTTARDMALLASAYIRRFPQALQYHSMTQFTYNGITQPNRNHLLQKDKCIDGLKTGYVAAAGYHLAATCVRDGMRLLAVVMGAPNPATREREALKLLNWGFRLYVLAPRLDENRPVATIRIWQGVQKTLPLYPSRQKNLVLTKKDFASTQWKMDIPTAVKAPVRKGQTLGKAVLLVNGKERGVVPLVSHGEVAKAGWLKRSLDILLQMIQEDRPFGFAGIALLAGLLVFIVIVVILVRRRRRRTSPWRYR